MDGKHLENGAFLKHWFRGIHVISLTYNGGQNSLGHLYNRPRSIYLYSNMDPRLSGQNCKFSKFLLSLNSQKRLGYKENNTTYRSLSRKPRSHVRILIYRTWPFALIFRGCVFKTEGGGGGGKGLNKCR